MLPEGHRDIGIGDQVASDKNKLVVDGLQLVDLSECVSEVCACLKRNYVDLYTLVALVLEESVHLRAVC